MIAACNAAVEELKATRVLADSLETENRLLKDRLDIEKRAVAILTELDETRKAESDALRKAVEAKNETIAAKDAVIAAQGALVQKLKSKRRSPLSRLGDILVGAAVIAVLK